MKKFKQILITGGCGFLGQWLVKDLLNKYKDVNIKIIDIKKNEKPVFSFENEKRVKLVLNKDICSLSSIINEFKDIDAVFHLAGYISFWLGDKGKLYSVNVKGTRNVLEAALKNKVKLVIHVSSVAALGYNDKKDKPIDENYKFNWEIAKKKKKYYMLTKHLGDLEVKKARTKGLNCIIVYPGLMYGPGDYTNSSRLIKAIIDRKIPFNMPGGTNIIDVRDVSNGIVTVLKKRLDNGEYLLSGYNLTFKEVNKTIADALKVKPPRLTLPRFFNYLMYNLILLIESKSRDKLELTADNIDSAFKFRYFSNMKAKEELNWEPKISFKKTIKDTIKWLKLK